jgi:probable HAF family extracellular repeat protein
VISKTAAAAAPAYKVTVLPPPAGFWNSISVWGVSGASLVGSGEPFECGFCQHALLWNGTAESVVDLHPSGFRWSEARAVSGASQVGFGLGPSANGFHALLWNGTAESVVDLHPTGYEWTQAFGVSGTSQVGSGVGPATGAAHALLWNGTADSVVDLHPAGFATSEARGVSGASQVGAGGGPATGGSGHALLWRGTAASVVDLHPAGFEYTQANAASGAIQVGVGATDGDDHALLWRGSAQSVVDLHPVGYQNSYAYGVSGAGQVGYGDYEDWGTPKALLWQSTAQSVVDLHSYVVDQLGPDFHWSQAWAIGENGTIVGYAQSDLQGGYSVIWTPIPEPTGLALLALTVPAFLRRQSRRGRTLGRSRNCAFATVLLSVSAASAPAAPPNIFNLGTLGGTSSYGFAINNAGQVTGSSWTTGDAATHAFLYTGTPGSGGLMHDLGGNSSRANGINDSGQIVGSSLMTDYFAFLYTGTPGSGGVMHDLGTLGGTNSQAQDVNDSGQIVGSSLLTGNFNFHAFLYTGTPGVDGMMHDLGTLGGSESFASAINNSGHIVGTSKVVDNYPPRAFLYTGTPGIDGVMHDLGSVDASDLGNRAIAINDRRQITGSYDTYYTEATVVPRAFLYTGTPGVDGMMHDLGIYGVGVDINNRGQIVGWCPECYEYASPAFVYTGTPGVDGQKIDLDDWLDVNNPVEGAKWTLSRANGINDNGLIIGDGHYDDGPGGLSDGYRAFLLDASSLLPPDLPGDFNFDGSVDAADYVVWRKTDGTPDGYNTWRSNFGRTSGSGLAASENPIPEPISLALLTLTVPALLCRHRL